MGGKNPFHTSGIGIGNWQTFMNLGTWFIDILYHETLMFLNPAFAWKIPQKPKWSNCIFTLLTIVMEMEVLQGGDGVIQGG